MNNLLLIVLAVTSEVLSSDFNLLDQDYYDINNAEEIYEQFIQKYNKEYYEEERSAYRFEVFVDNLKKINELNKNSDSARFGVTQFTDLTFDEFRDSYLTFSDFTYGEGVVYEPKGLKCPKSLDYRIFGYVTPVKDQGTCGSCYVFSAIGDIEGQYAKKNHTAVRLSEQQALDCGDNKGCDGGMPHEVFQSLATQGGSILEKVYPYEGMKSKCRPKGDKKVLVTGGLQLLISNEEDLKEALVNYGPLSIGIYMNPDLQVHTGGLFKTSSCGVWGHAALLVGYGNDGKDDYWLIKNSWGKVWGDEGYLRLQRGKGMCGIGRYVAHSIVE
ncbi:unnamed protein product [Leptosia nina]|uniref:Uncharacterized protein n=1 Tax=Leptosia nina TaxID=320188 RepID=A0AAV1JNI9_9NEOP